MIFESQIDEIELKVFQGLNVVDKVVQLTPVKVSVEFEFTPGYPAVIVADPAHSEPGYDPTVSILRVINLAPLELHSDEMPPMVVSANANILSMVPSAVRERLEEEAFETMIAEAEL